VAASIPKWKFSLDLSSTFQRIQRILSLENAKCRRDSFGQISADQKSKTGAEADTLLVLAHGARLGWGPAGRVLRDATGQHGEQQQQQQQQQQINAGIYCVMLVHDAFTGQNVIQIYT